MSAFEQALAVVLNNEGGQSSDPADPGNWTGGAVGQGECRGTKFGISASAYPTTDVAALTPATVGDIYRRDYWDKIAGDALPPPLALLMFDAAVNNGVERAIRWLQTAAGVAVDGVIGPGTLAAIKSAGAAPGGGSALCAAFLAERLLFMTALPTWRHFGVGWARRLCRLPFASVTMTGA
jgi:lysozyme family protein